MRDGRKRSTAAAVAILALGALSCTATPLPTPPSATLALLDLSAPQAGQVSLTGQAGAIQPGGVTVRIASASAAIARPVADDGSFAAALSGTRSDVFRLEVIDGGAVTFVVAFTGGPGTSVVPADAGPDGDSDGSPDAIDCAPTDPNAAGRTCPSNDPANCQPLAEICNGLDDDCDGTIDDGVCGCNANEACNVGQQCTAGGCMGEGLPCGNAAECLPEQICDAGHCHTP